MRERILTLLMELNNSALWVTGFIQFLENLDTIEFDEQPGTYTAEDLFAELQIRLRSTEKSGIQTIGMNELIDAIRTHDSDFIVKNFSFENESFIGIAYLNDRETTILGAVLIARKLKNNNNNNNNWGQSKD